MPSASSFPRYDLCNGSYQMEQEATHHGRFCPIFFIKVTGIHLDANTIRTFDFENVNYAFRNLTYTQLYWFYTYRTHYIYETLGDS